MAQLVVRGLGDEVKRRLQVRAAERGHSMEEEVRAILRAAVQPDQEAAPEPLGARMARRFAGLGGAGELPELRGLSAQAAELGEA